MTAKPISFALVATMAGLLLLSGCDRQEGGPIVVSAIGGPVVLRNPNQVPLDSPSALLAQTTAQGLVRFEASGQIEPALAQRWIVSDDGLRYTFRLSGANWADGAKVTAAQVVARLKATTAPGSRNRLKPLLGVIDEIIGMTDDVLEISLKSPRPNFLQLLAQPEMAIIRNGHGSGPYLASSGDDGALLLALPKRRDDRDDAAPPQPNLHVRGEGAALAVARFRAGRAHYVTGGTTGDLLVARAGQTPPQALRFDPVAGLFGLAFARRDGPLADAKVRAALSMAIDRTSLVADLAVPGLQPRASLLPPGTEVQQPAAPEWAGQVIDQRRHEAEQAIAAASAGSPIRLRVALPPGPGYRVVFAHLRRDWRQIGVEAVAVAPQAPADLRLIDQVAPVTMASWYLRSFTCSASPICSPEADAAMDAARIALNRQDRRDGLVEADLLLRDLTPFIPLTAPVRWSLVSPRLTGFQANVFGLHAADGLIMARR